MGRFLAILATGAGVALATALGRRYAKKSEATMPVDGIPPQVKALQLEELALSGAVRLVRAFPGIVFTSGKRSTDSQAQAMAKNGHAVAERDGLTDRDGLTKYILNTHRDTTSRALLIAELKLMKPTATLAQLAGALNNVMSRMAPEQLSQISLHVSGLAFDIKPDSVPIEKLRAALTLLPGYSKFLEDEAGLKRWHVEFKAVGKPLLS